MSQLSRRLPIAVVAIAAISVSAARLPESRPAASDPTFAETVAPILYRNCASCHRPGGLGPFSVLDYDSVTPKLGKMRAMVRSGRMPPWQAMGPRGVFRNDRRLTDEEKDIIVRWLDSGAKPGDMSKLPPRPHFREGWEIGTPDLIVSMPEEFTVPASGEIEYMYFEAPTNLTEEKWVQAIEIEGLEHADPAVVSRYLSQQPGTPLDTAALQRDLEARLGQALRLANDANCLALSEATDGAGAGHGRRRLLPGQAAAGRTFSDKG